MTTPVWGTLGCTHRVTPGRFAGKYDLNVLIIVQRNFTFKQERGFTKGKRAGRFLLILHALLCVDLYLS